MLTRIGDWVKVVNVGKKFGDLGDGLEMGAGVRGGHRRCSATEWGEYWGVLFDG